jgi:hydrogenase/urease accessory protein HupE
MALRLLVLLWAGLWSAQALAHALQPGYLELRPAGGQTWQVVWRVPDVTGRPMPIDAILPDNCTPVSGPDPRPEAGAWVSRFTAICDGGLAGGRLTIAGLERTRTDVLVRYGLENGTSPGSVDQTHRLTATQTWLDLPERQGPLGVAGSYFGLGVEHILFGLDHLLFVAGLMLLIRDRWRLFGAVTAFTLAHSITLALAALGWLFVPMPPVEAVIALSIAFLAAEALRNADGTEDSLAARAPWIVAFGFGLLHGLGFGTALLEIGLPQDAVPIALVSFNLGVEAGQILFITVMLLAAAGVKAARKGRDLPRAGRLVPAYGIGALGMFWAFERISVFFA